MPRVCPRASLRKPGSRSRAARVRATAGADGCKPPLFPPPEPVEDVICDDSGFLPFEEMPAAVDLGPSMHIVAPLGVADDCHVSGAVALRRSPRSGWQVRPLTAIGSVTTAPGSRRSDLNFYRTSLYLLGSPLLRAAASAAILKGVAGWFLRKLRELWSGRSKAGRMRCVPAFPTSRQQQVRVSNRYADQEDRETRAGGNPAYRLYYANKSHGLN